MSQQQLLHTSIPDLIERLDLEEKMLLLSAPNWWNTNAIERLAIPAVRMSDGPNGVRGSSHFVSTPSQCLPCATSLASTFDPEMIHKVGAFLAEEAKIKSSVVLLAPTCNIQRSPLGGRSFESFSEDPHLSGTMAAAYVNGLQSNGVAATIKHFVANDQEHERTAVNSVISDRALREVYLYPFMVAQKLAKPMAYMTSYGRIGNIHCSENPELLDGILRKEWGFDGIVMSDWFGTYSVDLALKAGLDLEMPGPPRWRTSLLMNHCLSSQKLLVHDIDIRVEKMLNFVQTLARKTPEVVYGDGIERSRDSPAGRNFCRKLAAEGMVLLQNKNDVLPVKAKKIAVIGPNAKGNVISGGGSAALKPTYLINPWEGIVSNAPEGVQINYAVGCYAHRYLPTLEGKLKTPTGEPGWLCTFYNLDDKGNAVHKIIDYVLQDTRVRLNDTLPPGLDKKWSIKLTGSLTVDKTMPFELGLAVAGRAKLWVDGKLLVDNWTKQRPGDFFYGRQGTEEEKGIVNLIAGNAVEVLIEYTNTPPPPTADEDIGKTKSQPALMRGLRLGGAEKINADQSIEDAVALATESDVAIIVGGLSAEWESEGIDRPNLALPARQDELIARVAKANPNTVVVIQAGSAVSMPWVRDVAGIVQAWLSGNEVGNAIADILFGKVNPAGRLPLTLPDRIEDTPSYLSFGSENGQVHYREDLFVGYKHYQARKIKPLFPFGFGLSYTTFVISDLTISGPTSSDASFALEVSATVKNTGSVTGSEVVQLYIELPNVGVTTPALQLRGFAKAHDLKPGTSSTVKIKLDKYAVSFWDTPNHIWKAKAGKYGVHVGANSDDLSLQGEFELKSTFTWSGL